MTKEEIIEGNKAISELLGWSFEIQPDEFGGELIATYKGERRWRGEKPDYLNYIMFEGFCYHTSYDKLMEAAQKICELGYAVQWTIMDGATCRIWPYLKSVPSKLIITDRPWTAIAEFSKWYNTTQTPKP